MRSALLILFVRLLHKLVPVLIDVVINLNNIPQDLTEMLCQIRGCLDNYAQKMLECGNSWWDCTNYINMLDVTITCIRLSLGGFGIHIMSSIV